LVPHFSSKLRKGGYLPFCQAYNSDHRALFLDFQVSALLQSPLSIPPQIASRKLCSTQTKRAISYISRKHEYLSQHNVFHRNSLLDQQPNHVLAEKIDRDLTRASLYAESSLPRRHPYDWSISLHKARSKVRLLQLWIRHLRNKKVSLFSQIKQLTQKEFPSFESPASVIEAASKLQTAKNNLYEVIRNHRSHRQRELETRISELELNNTPQDKMTATIIRNIKKAEEVKQLFRTLRHVFRPESDLFIQRLQVPSTPTDLPHECTN